MSEINGGTNSLDPRRLLPKHLRIPNSGHHFYKFGFSPHRNGCPDRSPLYHPLLVFIIPSILTARFVYSVVTPDHSFRFHLWIGDFGYFMNLKFHLNLTAALVYWMAVLSQIIHFYDYMCGRQQSYMKVFNMISGRITPQSIGLSDEKLIRDILKKARLTFKLNDFFRISISFISFFISFFSYITRLSVAEFILLGLPHTAFFGLGSLYIYNTICTQILYFFVISHYLKLKQRGINYYLMYAIDNKHRIISLKIIIYNTNGMIAKLNQIYLEIKEYDSNFWSKFLAIIWATITAIIAMIIFMFAFGERMHFNVRIMLLYAIFFYLSLLLLVIQMAGSVNFEAKKAYKLLASYKLVCMRTQSSVVAMARHGLKVWYLLFWILY